jgi:predicted RNase H-like HicB family nuclease
VTLHEYKTALYRQDDGSWVAEVPALAGCYALMPTREAALAELGKVFEMIAEEYQEKGIPLPADTTEIVHA